MRALLLLFAALGACGDDATGDDAGLDSGLDAGLDGATDAGLDGATDAGADAAPMCDEAAPDFLATLGSVADYESLTGEAGGVKYLAGVDGLPARAPIGEGCMFQNTCRFDFHIFFLHEFEETRSMTFEEYVDAVLRRPTRSWWGGDVLYQPTRAHPISGMPGTMLYTLYTEDTAGNRLVLDDIRAVDAVMRECIPFAATQLAFIPSSSEQIATARMGQAELAAEGIAVVIP